MLPFAAQVSTALPAVVYLITFFFFKFQLSYNLELLRTCLNDMISDGFHALRPCFNLLKKCHLVSTVSSAALCSITFIKSYSL
jgi:hypothetical protein